MERHAVLVFRNQPLTDEQQIAFTHQFGELERYETPDHIRKRQEERLGAGIADFSNLTRSGELMSSEDRIWLFKLDDRLWHSDSSFRPIPVRYSLLSGGSRVKVQPRAPVVRRAGPMPATLRVVKLTESC